MVTRVYGMKFGTFVASALLSGSVLVAASATANAAPIFDFSYSFYSGLPGQSLIPTGDTITGSFSGTLSGSNVINISNVSARFDGKSLTGPLEVYSYTPTSPNCSASSCYTLGGAVASFNGLNNNFLFIDSPPDASNHLTSFTNYFYVIQPWGNPGPGSPTIAVQYDDPTNLVENYNGDYFSSSFVLSAVPEPITLSLFGAGLAGAAAMRRRKKAKLA